MGGKDKRGGGRKPNLHGLYPRNFPKPVRWRIDQDYLDRLTPEERRWLSEFNDRFYGGDFRGSDPDKWPLPKRSDVNRTKNAGKTDAQTLAELGGNLVAMTPALEPTDDHAADDSPPPAYLNSAEYKTALEKYRQQLAPGRKFRKPIPTPALEASGRKLAKVIARGLSEDDNVKRQQAADPKPKAAPGSRRGTDVGTAGSRDRKRRHRWPIRRRGAPGVAARKRHRSH